MTTNSLCRRNAQAKVLDYSPFRSAILDGNKLSFGRLRRIEIEEFEYFQHRANWHSSDQRFSFCSTLVGDEKQPISLCYNVGLISCMENKTMLSLTTDFDSKNTSDSGSKYLKKFPKDKIKIPWHAYKRLNTKFSSSKAKSGGEKPLCS